MNQPTRPLLKRLLALITRRPIPPETGEENARRFVEVVTDLAHEKRVVLCYPHPGFRSIGGPENGWVWMLNPLWRARVLELLAEAPVRGAEFHAPDNLDGWTFSAYSTVPVPRVAQLALDQTLEGERK